MQDRNSWRRASRRDLREALWLGMHVTDPEYPRHRGWGDDWRQPAYRAPVDDGSLYPREKARGETDGVVAYNRLRRKIPRYWSDPYLDEWRRGGNAPGATYPDVRRAPLIRLSVPSDETFLASPVAAAYGARRCPECGTIFMTAPWLYLGDGAFAASTDAGRRADAVFCSVSCKERVKKRNQRTRMNTGLSPDNGRSDTPQYNPEQEHRMSTIPERVESLEERQARLEETFRAYLDSIVQTAQKIADRVPEDARIQEAVDKFIQEAR